MKIYPKYKYSGVPWLGEIPTHWLVRRLGSQFLERKQKVSDKDFTPLSVTKKGIVPQLDSAAKSNNRDNRKKVCKGDLVINSRSDRKGASGVSPQNGSVSLVNTVLIPLSLDERYVHNFFRCYSFQEEFYRVGRGIVADLWSTTYKDMRIIMIPVPTLAEQQQIARFLDWQTTKINTYIKARKELIALLRQGKQTIINEAVTKGLNPDVPMKDSGVEWLGEIPAHWEIKRAKHILKETDKRSTNGKEQLLSVSQYTGVTLRKKKDNSDIDHSFANSLIGFKVVQPNDLVVNIMLAWNGGLGVSPYSGIVSPSYRTYHFSSEVFPKYYSYLFKTELYKTTFKANSSGIIESRLRLYSDKFGCIESLVPPLHEQQQITRYLDWQTLLIDKIIACLKREIDLFQEYRNRLVSDVVTGKIDVRPIEIPVFEQVENELVTQDDEEFDDELIAQDSEE